MLNSLCHLQVMEFCSNNTPPNFMHSNKSTLRNTSRTAHVFKECKALGKVYSSQRRKNKPCSTQWHSVILSSPSVSWECESECESKHEDYKAVIPTPWDTHSSISAVLFSKNINITQHLHLDKFSGHLWHLKKFTFETEEVVNWTLMYKEKWIPANMIIHQQMPLLTHLRVFFLRLGSLPFGTTVRTESQQFNLSGVRALTTCSEHNFSSPYK